MFNTYGSKHCKESLQDLYAISMNDFLKISEYCEIMEAFEDEAEKKRARAEKSKSRGDLNG